MAIELKLVPAIVKCKNRGHGWPSLRGGEGLSDESSGPEYSVVM